MRNFSKILALFLSILWLSPSPSQAAPGCGKIGYRADGSIIYSSGRCKATVKVGKTTSGKRTGGKKARASARKGVRKVGKKRKKVKRVSRKKTVKVPKDSKNRRVQRKKKTVLAKQKQLAPARKSPAVLADVRLMQALLVKAGYPLKDIDGMMGRKTRRAMTRYAREHGIVKKVGSVMPAVLVHLKKASEGTNVAGVQPGSAQPEKRPEKRTAQPEFRRADVRVLQQGLVRAGYSLEHVDGLMEESTRRAMRTYYLKQQVMRRNATVFSAVLAHIKAHQTVGAARPGAGVRPVAFAPNAGRGKNFAEQCRGCHSFGKGEGNMAGPNLFGVMNQLIGSERKFSYSDTLRAQMDLGKVWNRKELHCYLKDPEGCKPGTNMGFGGIKSHKKRADIIAYLEGLAY